VVRLSLSLILSIGIKFNVRAMNPSRLSVSVKDDLDRQSTNRGFRNFENHARLDFGFRCARFS
jgi:hypothetical protein